MGGIRKEAKERNERLQQLYEEAHALAFAKASPILREALTKQHEEFMRILDGKKESQ